MKSASGIGKETAIIFAENGASVVVAADISYEGALTTTEESKKYATDPAFHALAIQVDVTDEASVDAMVKRVVGEFARIDFFVNSAGVSIFDGIDDRMSSE